MNKPKEEAQYQHLRERVVEELAIKQILAGVNEYGAGVSIPQSWQDEADALTEQLLHTMRNEAEGGGRHVWSDPCTNFRSTIGDENTCKICGWHKQNHETTKAV